MLSAKLAATPAPGTVIGGKYRVERPLGYGGMGAVVAATHLELNQPVAIKVLLPRAAKDDDSITRFVREGRAAARLTSPFAAKVYDSGRLPSGEPYLVLELLRGRDLRTHLAQVGRVPLAQAVDWILQAAHALAEAHAHRIIHRDVKPANLFLTETSSGHHIKVLDFGVSKELGGDESDLTNTASVLGTPRYMAPEQMRSAKLVDARCDVWSLGVVLYELTTGETPFRGDSATALCFDVMERTPVPPSRVNPELPPEFDALIRRCLAKDPDDRVASMEALTAALRPFASEGRASIPFIIPPASPSQPGAARVSTPDALAQAPASSRAVVNTLPGVAQPTPAERHSVETIRTWDTSSAQGSSVNRKRLPLVALGFGVGLTITAIVSVAVLGLVARSPAKRPTGEEAAAALAATPPSATSIATSPRGAASTAAPPSSAMLVTPATAVTDPPKGAATSEASERPPQADAAVTSASTGAAPKHAASGPPPCQPPYWIDKNGHRQAKPWCQ